MKKFLFGILLLLLFQCVNAEISVTYFGGAERVSGTCALVKTDKHSVIVDCGTFYEEDGLPVDNKNINSVLINADALVLTHAHADHAGLIPLLISKGFKGNIYCTSATKKIVFELYDDGWNFEDIAQNYFWSENQRINCQQKQRGTVTLHWFNNCSKNITNHETLNKNITSKELQDTYNIKCKFCKKCIKKYLEKMAEQFIEIKYGDIIGLSEDLYFSLSDAGHIPGSAGIFFDIKDGGLQKKVLFSGDLGSGYSKLVTDKKNALKADYIFLEATYGGKGRGIYAYEYYSFRNILAEELKKGKIVWIPALALQRTQKVLYEIKKAKDDGKIDANIPVYSLSPSSNGLTELYDDEIKDPSFEKWFPKIVYDQKTLKPDEYKTSKPKRYQKPSIVISASGMMDKGVSFSLLRKLLPRKDVTVFLVSYAGPKTPAGKLKKGAKKIKTKYGIINVGAFVQSFDIFSDHPDINETVKWLGDDNKKTSVYLVHGSKGSLKSEAAVLKRKGFLNVRPAPLNKKIIIK